MDFSVKDQHPSTWALFGEFLFEHDRVVLWNLAQSCKFFYSLFGRHYWIARIPWPLLPEKITCLLVRPITREELVPDCLAVRMLVSQHSKKCCLCEGRAQSIEHAMQSHPLHPYICDFCGWGMYKPPCLDTDCVTFAGMFYGVNTEKAQLLPCDNLGKIKRIQHSTKVYLATIMKLLPKKTCY